MKPTGFKPESSAAAPAHPAVQRCGSAATLDGLQAASGPDVTSLQGNYTPKLDAAVADLAVELRHVDARLTLSADIDPDRTSLESKLRAMQFRARIRQTIKDLEASKCK